MKFRVTAFLVLFGFVDWVFLMLRGPIGHNIPKDAGFLERLNGITLFIPLVLPFLGFWSVRTKSYRPCFRVLLSFDFVVSVIPIALVAAAYINAWWR